MDYEIIITSPVDTTNETTSTIFIYIVSRFRLFIFWKKELKMHAVVAALLIAAAVVVTTTPHTRPEADFFEDTWRHHFR